MQLSGGAYLSVTAPGTFRAFLPAEAHPAKAPNSGNVWENGERRPDLTMWLYMERGVWRKQTALVVKCYRAGSVDGNHAVITLCSLAVVCVCVCVCALPGVGEDGHRNELTAICVHAPLACVFMRTSSVASPARQNQV